MMTSYLDGKVAPKTGARGGMGWATLRASADSGAAVVLADRDEEALGVVTDALISDGRKALGVVSRIAAGTA